MSLPPTSVLVRAPDAVLGLRRPYRELARARSPNAPGPPARPLFFDAGTKPPPLEGLKAHEAIVQTPREKGDRSDDRRWRERAPAHEQPSAKKTENVNPLGPSQIIFLAPY